MQNLTLKNPPSSSQERPTNFRRPKRPRLAAEAVYATLWRWHFYAGIICAPALIVIAVTGSLYVFREEIDRFRFAEIMRVAPSERHAPLSDQCVSAMQTAPEGNLTFVRVPKDPGLASSFTFRMGQGRRERVFVDPSTGLVTGSIVLSDHWFWKTVLNLHRRLAAGHTGRFIVELATSWGLVLILTGLYLWTPRSIRGPWGAWLPRMKSGWRIFFKDLHSVLGMYVGCFALVTLFTGLFFTQYFRPYFSGAMHRAGLYPEGGEREPVLSSSAEGLETMPVWQMLERLESNPEITKPFTLFIPNTREGERDPTRAFVSRVGAVENPSLRFGIYFDPYTGTRLGTVDEWKDMSLIRKLTYSAYPVHVGSIFGLPTKMIAFLVCFGLVVLSTTGAIMWWLRRPPGKTGWVRRRNNRRVSKIVLISIIALGCVFPVLGVSLAIVITVEAAACIARHVYQSA